MANDPLTLVPDNLRKIANEISVQVLTHQPENIYAFTADYLNKQLAKREKKDTEIFIRDLIENDLTYEAMLKRWGISLDQANQASSVMQASVRRFLGRKKSKRDGEKIDTSLGLMTENRSIDSEGTSAAIILQEENPPGDVKSLNPSQVSSASVNRGLFCANPGISEGDVSRQKAPAVLAALRNMGVFDEKEESLDVNELPDELAADPSHETDESATRNFAKLMLNDIISGIFEDDPLMYGKSFDQEMDCLKVADKQEV